MTSVNETEKVRSQKQQQIKELSPDWQGCKTTSFIDGLAPRLPFLSVTASLQE